MRLLRRFMCWAGWHKKIWVKNEFQYIATYCDCCGKVLWVKDAV